ncbi:MAG: hypothetical protein GTO55_01540 [Armatimonadetes bacterium]|nr:hypothetical protein [Armatimonadota bacterium]NIM22960.1 hypothetical protein [Armatimonadota bacterium]NIM66831.1 hypothetical protein [Armatimonadota bacterium]NIM75372.1 hypothetical protein [Armatimonadota bacterium]NIN05019.1 hypothetical protein [Armatimonadota bacterium]
MSSKDIVIEKLIALGEKHDEIRAIILTSTRADDNAPTDILSDYDAELYVTDVAPFAESDDWFQAFGPVLVVFRGDENEPFTKDSNGLPCCTRLVIYEDGIRIDFQVAQVEALKEECRAPSLPTHFDVGYEVLLDKDNLTASLKPPTFKAHIPPVPTKEEYEALANNFWWDSTYVPKYLWRDDLPPAVYMLNCLREPMLRRMLEWSIETERNWAWKPGIHGRGLKEVLDAETYAEFMSTYPAGNSDSVWQALYRTTALFRKTATKVAAALKYEYPHNLDARVTTYLQTIQKLDPQITDREELAELLREAYRRLES